MYVKKIDFKKKKSCVFKRIMSYVNYSLYETSLSGLKKIIGMYFKEDC